jgi:hypothetical protein
VALGVLIALAVLAMPALWRVRVRRRRRPQRLLAAAVARGPEVADIPGGPRVEVTDDGAIDAARRQAHAAWDELVDTRVDHRLPVDVSASPRGLAEQVVVSAALTEAAADGARLLGRVEERARYARRPLHNDRLADELATALRTVRRAIAQRVSRRTRLGALLLPPSVVQRWRAAATRNAVSLTVDVGRRRDAALGAVNPRRLLPGRAGRSEAR